MATFVLDELLNKNKELTIDEIDNLISMVSHKEGDIQYLESILVDDSNYGSYMDYNGSVYDFFRLALENKKQYLKLQEEWNNILKKVKDND